MSKVIGLDLGSRTLGIAMSDVSRWYAYGVENFRFEEGNYKKAVEHVVELAKKEVVTENNKHLISSAMIMETLDCLQGVLVKKN